MICNAELYQSCFFEPEGFEQEAKAEMDSVATEESVEAVLLELVQLSDYNAELRRDLRLRDEHFRVASDRARGGGRSTEAGEGHPLWCQVRGVFADGVRLAYDSCLCAVAGLRHA